MKIRIRGNSLRLRLMQSEVKQFDQQGQVEERIQFGAGTVLSYSLQHTATQQSITASYSDQGITVSIPKEMAQQWANSNEIGLSSQQALPNGQSLSILIEKDFQCLTDRPGEDESDAFPNPNETC